MKKFASNILLPLLISLIAGVLSIYVYNMINVIFQF